MFSSVKIIKFINAKNDLHDIPAATIAHRWLITLQNISKKSVSTFALAPF